VTRVELDAVRAELDAPHVIDLRPDGWTIRHPLSCRPHLFDCLVHEAAQGALREPPGELGRFEVEFDPDGIFLLGARVEQDRDPVDLGALVSELADARVALEHVHVMAKGAAAESSPRSRHRQLAEALLATVEGLVGAP